MGHSIEGVCVFTVNPDIPCIMVQWQGYATSVQFRKIAESQLKLMQEYGYNKILTDNTNMKVVSMEDQEWTVKNWLPRALEAGYLACAILTSKDYFSRIAIENIISKVGDQLTIQYFDNIVEAAEWLKDFKG
ncbi:MAG TPA: hypothetical protein VEC36_04385 [Patescibacteria group bacterium]|nr:hypothetical protein [Patescibacteria group bacterium]